MFNIANSCQNFLWNNPRVIHVRLKSMGRWTHLHLQHYILNAMNHNLQLLLHLQKTKWMSGGLTEFTRLPNNTLELTFGHVHVSSLDLELDIIRNTWKVIRLGLRPAALINYCLRTCTKAKQSPKLEQHYTYIYRYKPSQARAQAQAPALVECGVRYATGSVRIIACNCKVHHSHSRFKRLKRSTTKYK